jgi:N-formylmaleamate deformylase
LAIRTASRNNTRVTRWLLVIAIAAACGGPQHKRAHHDDDDSAEPADTPFVDKKGFTPTSFEVKVSGKGRPIIFIPGLGCPGEVWADTVEHLGGKYQTHVLTLAGFAGLPPISKPLSATVRKELARYIRSNRLDHPVIVGHSMGGFIAYWIAANLPDLVSGVVIVDAGPALSGDLEEAKALRDQWRGATDEEFADRTRVMFSGMVNDPKRLAPILDELAKSDRKTLGDAVYELMTTDLRDKIEDIKAPVLVVLADGGLQERIKTQIAPIPHHEIIVLAHTHHFLMYDDPEGFYRAIDRFLAKH